LTKNSSAKYWTAYKALYLKSGPLQTFQTISSKLGQQMQWRISHFEEVSWSYFTNEDINTAFKIYDVTSKPTKSATKKGKKKKEEAEAGNQKITKGKIVYTESEFAIGFCNIYTKSEFAIGFA
jgi:hypothetical protein